MLNTMKKAPLNADAEELRRLKVSAAAKRRKGKKLGEDEGDSRDDENYRPGANKRKRPNP